MLTRRRARTIEAEAASEQTPSVSRSQAQLHPAAAPTLGRAFAYLASSAALSRGAPFLVNIAVARRLTPTQLGVPTVHFALVRAAMRSGTCAPVLTAHACVLQISTLVLTVREGFRRACLRSDADAADASALGWLVVPSGAVAAAVVAVSLRCKLPEAAAGTAYGAALGGVCAAGAYKLHPATRASCQCSAAPDARTATAFIEICAEPFHLTAMRRGAFGVRAAAETVSAFARALVTAWLLLAPPTFATQLPTELRFAAAQCAGSAGLLAVYAAFALAAPPAAWPGLPRLVSRASLCLLLDFSAQAAWKLVLAEGDKAVLLAWRAPDTTGVYGLASNLGGLVARILLQPLEEAAFATFVESAVAGGTRAAQHALAVLLRLLVLVRHASGHSLTLGKLVTRFRAGKPLLRPGGAFVLFLRTALRIRRCLGRCSRRRADAGCICSAAATSRTERRVGGIHCCAHDAQPAARRQFDAVSSDRSSGGHRGGVQAPPGRGSAGAWHWNRHGGAHRDVVPFCRFFAVSRSRRGPRPRCGSLSGNKVRTWRLPCDASKLGVKLIDRLNTGRCLCCCAAAPPALQATERCAARAPLRQPRRVTLPSAVQLPSWWVPPCVPGSELLSRTQRLCSLVLVMLARRVARGVRGNVGDALARCFARCSCCALRRVRREAFARNVRRSLFC